MDTMAKCSNPKCKKPGQALSHKEVHSRCLWCLGKDHNPYECPKCKVLCPNTLRAREKARQHRIKFGVWLDTHCARDQLTKYAGSVQVNPTQETIAPPVKALSTGQVKRKVSASQGASNLGKGHASLDKAALEKEFYLEPGQEITLGDSVQGTLTVSVHKPFTSENDSPLKSPKGSSHKSQLEMSPIRADELGTSPIHDPELNREELSDQANQSSSEEGESDDENGESSNGNESEEQDSGSEEEDEDEESEEPPQKKPKGSSVPEPPVNPPVFDMEAFKASILQGVQQTVAKELAGATESLNTKFDSALSALKTSSAAGSRKSTKSVPSVPSSVSIVPQNPAFDFESESSVASESSNSEEESKTKKRRRRELRKRWSKTVYKTLPSKVLPPKLESEVDDGNWMFSQEGGKKKSTFFPMFKGVSQQLNKRVKQHFGLSRRKGSKKFNPLSAYSGSYKTTDPDDKHFTHPHAASSKLINEIRDKSWLACSNPSHECRFQPSKDWGKAEKVAVERQVSAQCSFRITNAMSMSIKALEQISDNMRVQLAEFRSQPQLDVPISLAKCAARELAMSDLTSNLSQAVSNVTDGLKDLARCNADIFNLNAHTYIKCATERRQIYLDSSKLDKLR